MDDYNREMIGDEEMLKVFNDNPKVKEASTYIEVLEKRQGLKVGCLEGIAYRKGWIDEEKMRELAKPMLKNQYGQYLLRVIDEMKREVNSDTFR